MGETEKFLDYIGQAKEQEQSKEYQKIIEENNNINPSFFPSSLFSLFLTFSQLIKG